MTVAEQRGSPRYPAEWVARYRLDAGMDWRDSRVIDVSLDGATLELYNASPRELLAGPLYLQISTVGRDEVGATLRGVLRRHVRLDNGRVIVGIEIAVLRREERNLLHLLVEPRAFAR